MNDSNPAVPNLLSNENSGAPDTEQKESAGHPEQVQGDGSVTTETVSNSLVPSYDEHAVKRSDYTSKPNITDPSSANYVGEPTVVDVDFTYPTHTDPQRYVDGHPHGIYWDDEARKAAEIQRAKIEDREPNLENPPSMQGTPLIPTDVMKSQVPGDYVVEPDVTLPVVSGVNEENLAGYGDASHARKVKDETEKAEQ